MRYLIIGFLCFFSTIVSTHVAFGQEAGWVYKGEKEGVKVYLKKTGDVFDVKLTTSIQTTLSAFCHLLADVEAYPSWGYKLMNTELLSQENEYYMEYYSRIDFPWPLNDRDITLANSMSQDRNGIITFHSKSKSGLKNEVKDVIRLDDVETSWILHPPKNGWCYVEYYIHSDPEGGIPDWLVNMAIDVGPRETIAAIKRELKKPEYTTIRLAYIKE
jgi:hypothetical protein